ncbi:MAG: alpha/beta hydrolase [Rubrivivax sp.]
MNPLLTAFAPRQFAVDAGVALFARTGGSGPPLLLLHGHPQTHVIWHRVAPALAEHFTLVLADLRGYGDSDRPSGGDDHAGYAKRTMARDLVTLMRQLGHERFAVLAHDRGARVAHRMAVDHPDRIERMTLLDIAPTLAMYEQTDETFARAYWHWFFLIQRAPTPERLIEASPRGWMQATMGVRGSLEAFDPRALAEYERCLSRPGSAHAMCEDYRAAATIDLEHDRADRAAGRRVTQPLQVLWGERGIIARCFDALAEWRRVADDVQGHALPCGHYIPEEAPEALLAAALPFLRQGAMDSA